MNQAKIKRMQARARVPGTVTWARQSSIGVKTMAKRTGKSADWVRRHALALGGVKVDNRSIDINLPGASWRFPA